MEVRAQETTPTAPILLPVDVKLCSKVQDFLQPNYVANVDDRLFARQEIEYYYPITDDDYRNIKELSNIISFVNLNLITVPIPFKGSIYLNKSNTPYPKYDPFLAQKIYLDEISKLNGVGIPTVNVDALARSFPKGIDFFARRDHHWTGAAMEATADKLVEIINSLNINIDRSAQTILTRTIRPYGGSIASELEKSCGFKFTESEQRIFYSLNIKTKENLLGETNSDVILTGDSFTDSYFGFDKILSDKLKAPVTNMAIDGGACCASVNGYFSQLTPISQKPKVVVWTALAVLVNSRQTRELKPSIYGAYIDNKPLFQKEIFEKTTLNIPQNIKIGSQDRYYIKVTSKGPKTESIDMQINYGTTSEKINFSRSDLTIKENYNTSFYYELLPNITSFKNISISVPDKATVTFQLYKYKGGTL